MPDAKPAELPALADVLDEAARLEAAGRDDLALRRLYRVINGHLGAGHVADVDAWLGATEPAALSDDLILGALTITLRYFRHLPSRAAWFGRAKGVLATRGRDVRELLKGLG